MRESEGGREMLVGTESVCERESAVMDRDKSIRDRAFILLLINCT